MDTDSDKKRIEDVVSYLEPEGSERIWPGLSVSLWIVRGGLGLAPARKPEE